jgi:hypothetical protein
MENNPPKQKPGQKRKFSFFRQPGNLSSTLNPAPQERRSQSKRQYSDSPEAVRKREKNAKLAAKAKAANGGIAPSKKASRKAPVPVIATWKETDPAKCDAWMNEQYRLIYRDGEQPDYTIKKENLHGGTDCWLANRSKKAGGWSKSGVRSFAGDGYACVSLPRSMTRQDLHGSTTDTHSIRISHIKAYVESNGLCLSLKAKTGKIGSHLCHNKGCIRHFVWEQSKYNTARFGCRPWVFIQGAWYNVCPHGKMGEQCIADDVGNLVPGVVVDF